MELLTVSEVAKALKVSKALVYKKAEAGELCSVKIGKSLRFTEEQVMNFVEEQIQGLRK
jgi:excisionase family DNA binding protein